MSEKRLRLFLAGDVMTGRGIDQALTHAGDPRLYEPLVHDANEYIELAEAENGPIDRPLDDAEIWGEALDVLDRHAPGASIVNLETAVSTRGEPWPGKDIHYRMHPANAGCLAVAALDCCALANNHVLDWGREGLQETLAWVSARGITPCGAGNNLAEATRPAVIETGAGRVLVYGIGHPSSGIPASWAAQASRSGVWWVDELSDASVAEIGNAIKRDREPGDVIVVSIHLGGNWGYRVEPEWQRFAHALIERAGVHIVHGHSSHHPRPLEIHDGRLILYGCGDLINDYEGISGHERYRPELVAMYFPELDPADGRLKALEIVPMRIRRFQLERATGDDARWLADTLNRQPGMHRCRLSVNAGGTLEACAQL